MPRIPPGDLPGKVHKIQETLPAYVSANGPAKVAPLMERLKSAIEKHQFDDAAKLADEILSLINIH
jgi:protein-arginine kinase activator protein McsA